MQNLLLLSGGAIAGIVIGAVAVVAIIIIAWYISAYNKLQRLKNAVEEAWSTIDVFLKKRYDLIPNLVETVKGYAKHESETMTAVIKARQIALSAVGDARIDAEKELSVSLSRFLTATREAYPDLKANANFLSLQNQLTSIESEIEKSRRYYNGTVKELNTKIELFPSNLVARRMKLEKRAYFELDSAEERKAVKVSF